MTTTSLLAPLLPAPTRGLVRAVGWRVVAVLGSALLVGVLAGVAARLLMRLVAVSMDMPTGFTWLGSVMICVVFVVLAVPAAAAALVPWRPVRWLGAAATAVLVYLPVNGTASTDLAFHRLSDEGQVSQLVLAVSGFTVVALAVGPAASLLARWSSQRLLRR